MNKTRDSQIHRLIGGCSCLDFANTLNGHRGLVMHEYLYDYRNLVLWSLHAGILTEREAETLLRQASEHPEAANEAYRKAINLREAIFRVFSALAHEDSTQSMDLDLLNALRREALHQTHLVHAETKFTLKWVDETSLDRAIWPIAISAVELLTSDDVDRVRECAGDKCDWLFLDTSRNHFRRWCSMDECGNRSKMRRRNARKSKTTPERDKDLRNQQILTKDQGAA